MTIRNRDKGETFGRLFVIGGFTLVTSQRASGGDKDEVHDPLKREQGLARLNLVRDASQQVLSGATGSCRKEDDLQAIERAEDEGMMVDRE